MRNVITHELLEYSWDIYVVSINAGAQVAILIILIVYGPCVVIVDHWDRCVL